IDKAESQFMQLPGMTPELCNTLIESGFLSCEDVAVLTPAEVAEMGGLDEDTSADLVAYADEESERLQKEAKQGKHKEAAPPPAPLPAAPRPAPTSGAGEAFDNLFKDTPAEAEAPAEATEANAADVAYGLTELPTEGGVEEMPGDASDLGGEQ